MSDQESRTSDGKFAKGVSGNPAGKPAGVYGKSNKKVREAIAMIADDMAEDFKRWLEVTAEGDPARNIRPDPKGAALIFLQAIEYHIPKLARVESHVAVEQKTHEQWLDECD